MPVVEYKGFHICIGYSYSGKTPHYRVWTKDFVDLSTEIFRSIKSAKKYIKEELVWTMNKNVKLVFMIV